jgi:hypothetical protein
LNNTLASASPPATRKEKHRLARGTVTLFSRDHGWTSSADIARPERRRGGLGRAAAGLFLKGGDFLVGQDVEERLEQNDGFAETGVEVVVKRIKFEPDFAGRDGGAVHHFFEGGAQLLLYVFNHLQQIVDLMKELRALG